LIAVFTRDRDDQVVAVQDDLCPAHPDAVDPLLDDLTSLIQRFPRRRLAVHGAGSEGHPGAALKVDA
jgi:hypothetical protein